MISRELYKKQTNKDPIYYNGTNDEFTKEYLNWLELTTVNKNDLLPNIIKLSELLKALYTEHEEETGYISMTQELAKGYLKYLL